MDAPINLSISGLSAKMAKSEFYGGFDLIVDGVTQSNVVPEDPSILNLDYVRRLGDMIDHYFPSSEDLSVLHLGAGAMSLVRYIGAKYPDALQVVVELEKEIVDLVEEVAPLKTPAEIIYGDAKSIVRALPPNSFDLIIADIYMGISTPDSLTTVEFYSELSELLNPYGILLANITGGDGLEDIARQYRNIEEVFTHCVLAIDSNSLNYKTETNALVAASDGYAWLEDLKFPTKSKLSTTIITESWLL